MTLVNTQAQSHMQPMHIVIMETTVISHEYLDPEDLIRVCLHDDLAQFHMSLDYMGDMIKGKQGPWGHCTNPLY